MKQYGKINGQKTHDHEKERQDKGPAGYGDKGLRLDNTQTQEEIKGRKHEPKSPRILHVIKDKYKLERIAKPDNARAVEMV